jgi:hypothetical protein
LIIFQENIYFKHKIHGMYGKGVFVIPNSYQQQFIPNTLGIHNIYGNF